jgi:23S rRNA (uridine2552-2'-O)-methyltransferase
MVKPSKGPGGGKKSGAGGKQASTLSGRRAEKVKLKNAGSRRASSQRWLERQLNDPYVAEAQARGYRSRAAFKLMQLDEKFRLLKRGQRVVDLGAAPGGWTQVAVEKVGPSGKVVAIDILPMGAIPGATVIELDFLDETAPETLRIALGGPADLVLSDMAAPTTGHTRTDHLRIMGLAETAHHFAAEVLAPGGSFVCKLFQGGATQALLTLLKRDFAAVRHVKPAASRAESAELYMVATGFRGGAT